MTQIKTRKGGVWVDEPKIAQARIGGAWVPFGPSDPDPGDQSIFTGLTPFGISEDGFALAQGVRFRSSRAGTVKGGRWYAGASPPTSAKAALYRVSDMAELARATFAPMVGLSWNDVLYAPGPAISAGVDYMAVCWTQNRYPYTASYAWPRVSGDLTADGAFYLASADLAFPTTPTTLNLWCDIIFDRA